MNAGSRPQNQPLVYCDIEAAVFDASTSAGSNTNTSTNNTSSRNLSVQSQQQHQQHDGDPFHRRSCAATMTTIHGSKEDMEALIPPELKSSIRSGNDSEVNGSGRNRNNLSLSAPLSGGKLASAASAAAAVEPRLLHPILLKIPLHMRFGVNGLICNVLFMVVYNYAVSNFEHRIAVSTIYSIVYFVFIPLGHASGSILVFGWPEQYISSLMSNFPIGLTAIAIGGMLTAYLDAVHFSNRVDDFVRDNFTFSKMPPRLTADGIGEESQFWSSIIVLIVTSIWTYVLTLYINSIPTKSEKKEL